MEEKQEKSFLGIIVHSFFIVPFLIAVFCVLLFASIHLLTREQRSAYDYLEDVKTGGATKRWQGAFELSKILANPDLFPKEDRFSHELINAFEHAKHDDPRVRQYLALAMGRTGRGEFVQPIISGLKAEQEINIPALLYALGMLKNTQAAEVLYPFTNHPEARIRSIAVVALGNMADPASKDILKRRLRDSEPNVQWGAAISLAQMNDASGKSILMNMLDRAYWSKFTHVDRDEQTHIMMTAINAAKSLDDLELNEQIQHLAQTDTNMKIRAIAQNIFK